ncbi:MAG: hypothetical protein AAGI11_05050 [Pseudomonadota bacterium]
MTLLQNALSLGLSSNKRTLITKRACTLLLTALAAASAGAQEWNNPGEGDWFAPLNWTPNALPSAGMDATINNGGTAVFGANAVDVTVRNLLVGVDGGEGAVLFADFFSRDLLATEGVNVGVTNSGTAASLGVLRFDTDASILDLGVAGTPLRVGVSNAAGDADGRVMIDGNVQSADLRLVLPRFSIAQFGVAESTGQADATVAVPTLDIDRLDRLEVGVSRGDGQATARVSELESSVDIRSLSVGVATGAGHADGELTGDSFLRADAATGSAQIGVSDGSGSAVGVIDLSRQSGSGRASFGRFDQIDIGISNGSGDATGTVLTAEGLSARTINIGFSNGSGVGSGLMRNDHWLSLFDTMNLGPGATVVLNGGSTKRGGVSFDASGDYGAIDVGSATLDGTLVVDFDFIPEGPARFELINSASADGLSGDFATVELRNLNPGFTATTGFEVDAGVEKYILELTGAPSTAEWTNSGSDDWFNPANWSGNRVPSGGEPALVNNGGEAQASGASAPEPLNAYQIDIGVDGGSGSLQTDGVEILPTANLQIGVLRPGYAGGGASVGGATLIDTTFRSPGSSETEPLPPVPNPGITSIGAAYSPGTAEGQLTVSGGEFDTGDFTRVGYVLIEEADTGAVASAVAELVVDDDAVLSGGGQIVIASANMNAANSRGSSQATVRLTGVTLDTELLIGDPDAFGSNTTAEASATAELRHVTFGDGINLFNADVDGENGLASAVVNVTVEDSLFLNNGLGSGAVQLQVGLCEAQAAGAQVLPSLVELTVSRSRIESSALAPVDLSLMRIDNTEGGVTDGTGRASFTDSEMEVDEIKVSRVEVSETSIGRGTALLSITGSTLVAAGVEIAEAELKDNDAVAIVDGRLLLEDTTADVSESVVVGLYTDDGTNADSLVTARLGLTNAALDTPLLEIGLQNPASLPMDAEASLNPSYIRTDDLQVGPDGRIVLVAEGPTRATRENLGQPGRYAAIDANTATINGEVIVQINYPAPEGQILDVLRTDPGGLSGSGMNFRFIGAPPDAASLEVVNEGGQDVLRLTVNEDLSRFFLPQSIPLGGAVTLMLLMLLMSLGANTLRTRDSRQ